MITTKENLRATATEAYFKGVQDGWRSGVAAGRSEGIILADAHPRTEGRAAGAAIARDYMRHEIQARIDLLKDAIAVADTRWEKRLLTGRLEGLETALKIVVAQA